MGCGMECGTLGYVKRGKSVGWHQMWNVVRCGMWQECGLWHGMRNVVRCGMRWNVLWHGMWNVGRCKTSVGCDTERYMVVVLCEM